MIKDVIITIIGQQSISDESDSVELITDGRFGYKDGEYFISYEDSRLTDRKTNSKTVLYIKNNNSVVMQRTGEFSSRMVIEKGVRNTCLYSTPHGNLELSIFGECVKHSLSEKGGRLEMSYTIDTQSQFLSRNKVNISIKEV